MLGYLKQKLSRYPRMLAILRILRGHSYVHVPWNRYVVLLDYAVSCKPRWGWGKPSITYIREILEFGRAGYRTQVAEILALKDDFESIPRCPDGLAPLAPHWENGYLPPLDAMAIYTLLSQHDRRHYFEVGSGNSTKFAKRAIMARGHSTQIVSIDPHPRAEIDQLADELVRSSLEDIDLSIFQRLGDGDVLFVDNSHRSFMNSDVTVFFLDVLPNLATGVLVGIHDIYLPDDYPFELSDEYYSEQYLMACYLLGRGIDLELILPMWFICHDDEFQKMLVPLTTGLLGWDKPPTGNCFWFRTEHTNINRT